MRLQRPRAVGSTWRVASSGIDTPSSIGKTEPPRVWLRHVDDLGEGRGEANAVAEAGRMDDEEGEGG